MQRADRDHANTTPSSWSARVRRRSATRRRPDCPFMSAHDRNAVRGLASQFFALSDCYGGQDRLSALRASVEALALHEEAARELWLSEAPELPKHAHRAARRGVGALYAALRGLRSARLGAALHRWAINAVRAAPIMLMPPPTSDAARRSFENTALASELSELELAHARQSGQLQAELDRASEAQRDALDQDDSATMLERIAVLEQETIFQGHPPNNSRGDSSMGAFTLSPSSSRQSRAARCASSALDVASRRRPGSASMSPDPQGTRRSAGREARAADPEDTVAGVTPNTPRAQLSGHH